MLKGLESLYAKYNRKRYVHPDPLEFLYAFADPSDRELVALISACLAYGRVHQILKGIRACLDIMGNSPRRFLLSSNESSLAMAFAGFNYRFTRGHEMARFMTGLKRAIERHGNLEAVFSAAPDATGAQGTISRLKKGVDELLSLAGLPRSYLLPDPAKKSACKRLFLFLRWMVRADRVDPGGWSAISPADLVIPLDTHMFHIATDLGLTSRKQANLATALEITRAFARLSPSDPVKYDFVLTRFGIRDELSRDDVVTHLG
jgi:uncharacterized protein (TIGR02757 family)